jgi:hypothetical protein
VAGILQDLEQYRLRAHGEQTLVRACGLIDELMSLGVLAPVVTDILSAHRDDMTRATQAKHAQA